MRLDCVEHGHRPEQAALLDGIRQLTGGEPPDVVKTAFYRPEIFGGAIGALTQQVMRGPSAWSTGERELFAAFVSRRNQCPF